MNLTDDEKRMWMMFAAHALQALIPSYILSDNRGQPKVNEAVGELAFRAADNMILAYINRGRQPQEPPKVAPPKPKPTPAPAPAPDKPTRRRVTDYHRRVTRVSTEPRQRPRPSRSTAESESPSSSPNTS